VKILLLGANGQVGFELHRSLAPLGELVATSRSGTLPGAIACEPLDLAEPEPIRALIERIAPDWIVNAAAYTAVDKAEDEPGPAARINAEAPGVIGEAARAIGAAVLHFSTDYVFAGDSARPYREDDATGPLGEYGRTKLPGEQALAASGARHLV
jgi:dTDP-4-dehydrorhamnose reductase